MNQLVADKLLELKKICVKHSVAELCLFGSALHKNNFTKNSDLDFTVVFNDKLTPLELGSAFLNLLEDLETLFNRKIDLVSYRVIKNPMFKEELDKTKKILYAAA
jgi:predicted nucleotidyltransferase